MQSITMPAVVQTPSGGAGGGGGNNLNNPGNGGSGGGQEIKPANPAKMVAEHQEVTPDENDPSPQLRRDCADHGDVCDRGVVCPGGGFCVCP